MKLGLGTAQFGMQYGIANTSGPCAKQELAKILAEAANREILFLDTAPSYKDSQIILGELCAQHYQFNIVTKIPSLKNSSPANTSLLNILQQSLQNLRVASIYGLLIHDAEDLLGCHGVRIYNEMQELKAAGLVKKIGVSIYTGEQLEKLMNLYTLDLIQLPLNIFDQRLLYNGYLAALQKMSIEIHARSIFLQGLLLMNWVDIPVFFNPIKPQIKRYQQWLSDNHITALQAALCFIASIKEIDIALVGVDSLQHLREILACPIIDYCREIFVEFSIQNDKILNPSCWL